jgi:glycosyltransferase involved in cell wall biosynthesis
MAGPATNLPTFSIILETENLATADIRGLVQGIENLAGQDVPPMAANEVLVIDSGDIPDSVRTQLLAQYPWLTLHHAPPGITYYEAKMLGAQLATGDIVVYFDSDCLYAPDWLRNILTTLRDRPDIAILAGETRTRGSGIYGTAMGLVYIFPQYSGQTQVRPGSQYFLNNVAFRRSVLLHRPIPTHLPLYRGNCVIHARQLSQQGLTIWQHPQARASHAPPHGWFHFVWRFLLIGYDYYWQRRILREQGLTVAASSQEIQDPTASGWYGKLQVLDDRLGKLIRANPWHLALLPLALPVVLLAMALIGLGYWITVRSPDYLLQRFERAIAARETPT